MIFFIAILALGEIIIYMSVSSDSGLLFTVGAVLVWLGCFGALVRYRALQARVSNLERYIRINNTVEDFTGGGENGKT